MYADDITLVADSEEALREAMAIVQDAFQKWGLHINAMKTKIMKLKCKDESSPGSPFQLGSAEVQNVQKFKYLGAICSADLSMRPELSNR